MQNPKRLSDLLTVAGKRLGSLRERSAERATVLIQVRAALTPKLADSVVTAGIEAGRLTIGVASSVWASRLRYCADALRKRVAESSGIDLKRVRIRVVPPAS